MIFYQEYTYKANSFTQKQISIINALTEIFISKEEWHTDLPPRQAGRVPGWFLLPAVAGNKGKHLKLFIIGRLSRHSK